MRPYGADRWGRNTIATKVVQAPRARERQAAATEHSFTPIHLFAGAPSIVAACSQNKRLDLDPNGNPLLSEQGR